MLYNIFASKEVAGRLFAVSEHRWGKLPCNIGAVPLGKIALVLPDAIYNLHQPTRVERTRPQGKPSAKYVLPGVELRYNFAVKKGYANKRRSTWDHRLLPAA